MKILKTYCFVIYLLLVCVYSFGIDIISARVNISIPRSQINYTLEVLSKGQVVKIVLDRDVSTIRVNGVVTKFRKVVDNQLFLYLIDIPKDERVEITISYYYDIISECRSKGFVLFSEVMRTLPYLLSEDNNILNETVYFSVETDTQDNEFMIFFDGKTFSGAKSINFQKRYNSVVVLGYFDVFSISDFQVNVVVPKNNESVALSIINSLRSIREVMIAKYGISFPRNLNIVYSKKANFSESIGNTIILSSFSHLGESYFSNVETLENFLVLVHEILHSAFSKNVDNSIIDIFEGFIQYVSIDVLAKVLGQDSVKDTIFNNYISQIRYASLYKGGIEIVRYKKYPLVFRYISSVVGEVSLISFFKYIISVDRDLTFDVFRESFRNVVGVNFDSFAALFDNIPVLWNLDMVVSEKEIKVFSTAPIRISTSLLVETANYRTNIVIDILRDSSTTLLLDSEIVSVILNPSKSFPELFYYDNYFGFRYPQVVEDFVREIQNLINTEDFSKINSRKIVPSKNVRSKLSKFISDKKRIFSGSEIKIGIENIVRYGNQIVVEIILYSPTNYRQGFLIINYGKSFYISDFGIIM